MNHKMIRFPFRKLVGIITIIMLTGFSIVNSQTVTLNIDNIVAERKADKWYNEAVNMINANDYYNAITLLEKVTTHVPDYVPAYIEKGKIYYKKERYADAEIELQKAVDLEGTNGEALFNLYYTRFTIDTSRVSVDDFSKPILNGYEEAEAFYYRGLMYLLLDSLDDALSDFTIALDKNESYARAYHDRATTKYRLNDLQGSIHDYRMAVTYDPTMLDALINMGIVKKKIGDYQGAEADFTQAIAVDSLNAMALSNRGGARYILMDLEGAQQDFEQAQALNPESYDIKCNLGSVISKQGKYEDALWYFDEILKNLPEHKQALVNRGLTYELLGKLDEACADWNQAFNLGLEEAGTFVNECKE